MTPGPLTYRVFRETGPWGPFLEAPGDYRAREVVLFFIPDGSFKSFENYTVKLSAKETKWTSLEVKTHVTFPYLV